MAPPFRKTEFEILYGEGTSREGELIDFGVEHNLVDKAGAWYSYQGNRIGQGKENVRTFLRENPATADEIDNNLRNILLASSVPASPEADAPDEATAKDKADGQAGSKSGKNGNKGNEEKKAELEEA